ncbi:GntR family transcriptional regulator [Roseovarius pacificus]|uniref:GntR family transcriptional regulator n=1 Tax=Roseovarius pacificus TaxID=337701 RepID=UPI002A18A75D|nr:GntR family transcriptional regulator [Roseovarius pacificus]
MGLPGIEPVERANTLAEDLYMSLRKAIVAGTLKPGEKIATRAVAESAGVSFTPAREAIARLIADGALEQIGPKSVVVPHLRIDALEEITKLRLSLETMAAEAAAIRMSKDTLARLKKVEQEYEEYRNKESFTQSLTLNEEFHFMIYRASEMPRLVGFIETLWVQIGPSFNLLLDEKPIQKRPLRFHNMAIEGIEARNGNMVAQAIRNDLEFGYERLKIMVLRQQNIT